MSKKLEYLLPLLLQNYVRDDSDKFYEYIESYLKYLSEENQGTYDKIVNIVENNHPRTIYPELLDNYFNEKFQVFDSANVNLGATPELIEDKKRNLTAFAKFLNGNKGKMEGINLLFSFLDFTISISYDETITTPLDYTITISTSKDVIEVNEYIESAHPIGIERNTILDVGDISFYDNLTTTPERIGVKAIEALEFNGAYYFNGVNAFMSHDLIIHEPVFFNSSKFTASDGAISDFFGRSVAMNSDGTKVIVGSHGDDNENGIDAGAAYVYDWNGVEWTERPKLMASDGAIYDQFGISVAMNSDGTKVIVGSYGDDNENGINAGAAYVYDWNGVEWTERPKLMASDGAIYDQFGISVAMNSDGTKVIVGSYGDDNENGINAGAAYIFSFASGAWTETKKLMASDGGVDDQFGYSVAMNSDGTKVIVGSYRDDNKNGIDAGAAYVYDWNGVGWTERPKLMATIGSAGGWFGFSVAMNSDGTKVIVGSYPDDNKNGIDAGAAYVYDWNGVEWTERPKLMASDGGASYYFGGSVAINSDGTKVIVGADDDDNERGIKAGAAYVYDWNGVEWTECSKLMAFDGATYDQFGRSVAINSDGTKIIVGSFADDDKGTNSGSAYIFSQYSNTKSIQNYTPYEILKLNE